MTLMRPILWLFAIAFLLPQLLRAQNNPDIRSVLQGKVFDAKTGLPLEGANVRIKGTTNQSATDSHGQYQLQTGQKLPFTIVVSLVGYKEQEFVTTSSPFDIRLTSTETALSDVVVVGYGTQKKISVTNSVAQVSGAELQRRPVSNIQQSLQGQLPGVTVLDQGGTPGNSSATIRVRGITTFNIGSTNGTQGFDLSKNDALVIVDGAEQRLTDINPSDIESVSILKDAASTAIYGSRATNGVILVTTKTAKRGPAQVSFNSYYALQRAINRPQQLDIYDYMKLEQTAYNNAGLTLPSKFTDDSINTWVHAANRYQYPLPNTWFQTQFRSAPQTSQELSVAGGSDVIRSRLSVRYADQEGIIKNYGSQLAELRLNTDYNVSPAITVNGNIDYRYNYNYYPTVDPINYFYHGSMWAVHKYPTGNYGLSTQGNNPQMYDELGGLSKNKNDYLTAIIQGTWKIVRGLSFNTYFAGRVYDSYGKYFTNAYVNTDSLKNITKTVSPNSLTEARNTLKEYTWQNLLTYEQSFDQHHIKALAGYSQIDNVQTTLSAYRQNFYNNDIQSISQGASDGTQTNSGSDAEYALRSYFGRINYDFAGKYLLEVNGRRDGSSKFTGTKQYGFFPSFSAGWLLSREDFWDAIKPAIQDLKLRGSWGKTGNQSVSLYSYYSSLTAAGYDFGGNAVQGYRESTLANTDLGWESTTQLDLGLDASAFDRKLNVTVDYYRKVTNDILLNLDIPATVGLAAPYQNAGSVENKGWEFSFNYAGKTATNGFRYAISGNLSINNNKVLDLKGTGPYITGSDIDPRFIVAKGLPINSLYGYKTAGLFQAQDEINSYGATYASNTKPGDVKYIDRNKDGVIDAKDMTVIGNPFPKYTFALNPSFGYKNFELNLLFQGVAKVDTRLSGALAEMGDQEGFTHKIYRNNYWTPQNTHARFPRPVKSDLRNVATSDRLVFNGSYLRLKNIQLAYNLPASVLRRSHIHQLKVYVAATNILTFSKLNQWNLDPETYSGRATYYPQTSVYTLGLNLNL